MLNRDQTNNCLLRLASVNQCGKIQAVPIETEANPHNSVEVAATECGLNHVEPSGEPWRWCLRCGHELRNEKCKLRCPRCHYFMSCSDFD